MLREAAHPDRRRVNDDVELRLGERLALDALDFGRLGERLGFLDRPVQHEHFRPALPCAEHRRSRRSASAQNQDAGTAQAQALLQRRQDSGDVGVVAEQLAVRQPHHRVAGTDFLRPGVGLFKVRQNRFLERHGHRQTLQRHSLDQRQQVFHAAGLQRQVDGVDGFAAERRVHHQRRQGVLDRVACDAVNLGAGIDLVDAVDLAQGARGDLAGSSLLTRVGGGKRKRASGAHAQHAADDSRVAHQVADNGRVLVCAFQKADHCHVVRYCLCGRHQLVEVRRELAHARHDGIQVADLLVVVPGKHDCGHLPQLVQLRLADGFRGLDLDVEHLAAGFRRLHQHRDLRSRIAIVTAAVGSPPAGRDRRYDTMLGQELADFRERRAGVDQVIQPELEEGVLLERLLGGAEHLGDAFAGDGHANATQPRTEDLRG